jgi:hypothetical protein
MGYILSIWGEALRVPKNFLKGSLQPKAIMLSLHLLGDVAQLEERNNRTVEVRGSSPLVSILAELQVSVID